MSSEISQLCLEALSPLAEQCAKNQEKDTPLFIATRHFLKVLRIWLYGICTTTKHVNVMIKFYRTNQTEHITDKNILAGELNEYLKLQIC